jgi:putative membrane protein
MKTVIISNTLSKKLLNRSEKVIKNKSTRIHLFLLLVVTAVFIWSVIKPTGGYSSWATEAIPAIVGIIIVIVTYNKFRLTTLSYMIILILTIVMLVGGHYTYTRVPIFNWIKDNFDLSRNHYDRFGHLLKGMFTIVIREILLRKTQLTKGSWLFSIVISISLAIAAMYEIIEFLFVKITQGGKTAENFLGMQGDQWDSQWDMLLALIGSIFALIFLSKLHDRFLKNEIIKK